MIHRIFHLTPIDLGCKTLRLFPGLLPGFAGMVLKLPSKNTMVVPFIALIAIIVLVIVFLTKAGKRKSEGKGMGEPGKGTM